MSVVRGWCPSAWRPMAAGDGLLLRIRPRLARLSVADMRVVADVARTHGNGAIDLTNRAALQLRGVREHEWRAALARLVAAGLVDGDAAREARAVLVAPDWRAGDDTQRIATALHDRIDELPPLPGKIGVAIDAGAASVLGDSPADFRIERGEDGGLLLRADGRATGIALSPGGEVDAVVALAEWFVASGGATAGRMARHAAPLPAWATGAVRPRVGAAIAPGPHPLGRAIGLPFGRIMAEELETLAALPGIAALRATPWRVTIAEGVSDLPARTDAALLHVDACVGAPACPQASVATRALAVRLARDVPGRLHVSGCAKGCARQLPADVVVTGRDGRYDLGHHARAGDASVASGLAAEQLIALLESPTRAA